MLQPRPWAAFTNWRRFCSQGWAVVRAMAEWGLVVAAASAKAAAKAAAGGRRWHSAMGSTLRPDPALRLAFCPLQQGVFRAGVVRSVTSNLEADEGLLEALSG